MGGVCSRKRDQHVVEDDLHRGVSGRYCRSGSTKWLRARSLRAKPNHCAGGGTCPSLMDLCIKKMREDFHKYNSFSILPRDISQQIFNELVDSHCLTEVSLEAFRDCALQDIDLGEYVGVNDDWMDVISSQGLSLLSVDVAGSQVTDDGLRLLKDCSSLQALTLSYCDQFSEYGLKHISGLSNLTSLSIRKSSSVKPDGMRAFSNLFNLEKLDLERCSEIHGGFVHLKGMDGARASPGAAVKLCLGDLLVMGSNPETASLHMQGYGWLIGLPDIWGVWWGVGPPVGYQNHMLDDGSSSSLVYGVEGNWLVLLPMLNVNGLKKLEYLNIGCCKCVTDSDIKSISELINLKELQISNSSITDIGITYLRGLEKLTTLNVEGCNITAACLEFIHALTSLACLNLNRCGLSDDGFEKISGLKNLKRLSLAFNRITDACLVHLKGLTNLEYLNLDSCRIGDGGLANLTGLTLLKSLVLSDTDIGNSGLRYISGLKKLEDLNVSFTTVTDNGLKRLSGLTQLKSLNLDARQITDAGLANLTSLSGLITLDLFGARISDNGTTFLRSFKNLQSLEICGGGLTDAGVKNIREIVSLTQLNLSQNCNLTDKTLELISGMTALRSLNVSNSRITNEGLRHLKPLKNLRTLTLESCKVTASGIKKLQSTDLPNLISFRPE
ncbi:F-box/LRR-repeat protein 14 [Glycine soja]